MTEAPSVTATAPATIANLGPGFDLLGLALPAPCDRVTARLMGASGVRIASQIGDDGRLPTEAERNTAGIAAMATLRRAGIDVGIELDIDKGMPIGSGLGSSAASAAAAACAVNALIGSPLRRSELVAACVDAEAAVSGRHADNVAPSLLGGLVLVLSVDPLDIVRLPVPEGLLAVVATPDFELETRRAREALPKNVPLTDATFNSGRLAAFVTACFSNDLGLLARAVDDRLHVPARAPLIPGCEDVMQSARDAGALASSISGSGPSVFAFCHGAETSTRVASAMREAFAKAGLDSHAHVGSADSPGARTR
ncbi:MAG: homoserine kinase [Planctomycetes bacterium]|jgi:homoserine kinase|nr:homoserine kinase [Planctomycetota bacterium]